MVGSHRATYFEELHVAHLESEPSTTQHNTWSESGFRESKEDTATSTQPPDRRRPAIGCTDGRLNFQLRRPKSLLPADELRRLISRATAHVDRGAFYAVAVAVAAVATVAYGVVEVRARRRAERRVIFATTKRIELIIRYRGGAQTTLVADETIK